jgi:hypothetical protein
MYPLPCPHVFRRSRAGHALWVPFGWKCQRGNENFKCPIFFEKIQFFSILISEFKESNYKKVRKFK